jgi:hypothetical protein
VIFALLDLCRNYFLSEKLRLNKVWLWSFAGAIVIWVIVRSIHKYTRWLEVKGM